MEPVDCRPNLCHFLVPCVWRSSIGRSCPARRRVHIAAFFLLRACFTAPIRTAHAIAALSSGVGLEDSLSSRSSSELAWYPNPDLTVTSGAEETPRYHFPPNPKVGLGGFTPKTVQIRFRNCFISGFLFRYFEPHGFKRPVANTVARKTGVQTSLPRVI